MARRGATVTLDAMEGVVLLNYIYQLATIVETRGFDLTIPQFDRAHKVIRKIHRTIDYDDIGER